MFTISSNAQATLKISDFQIIDNSSWTGQLTYKDYQSGKLTSVATTMQIRIEGDSTLLGNPVDIAYDSGAECIVIPGRFE